MEPDRYAIYTERLDWLLEVDLPLLDFVTLLGELLRDVGGSDRAEQLAFLADAGREGERHLLQLARILLR